MTVRQTRQLLNGLAAVCAVGCVGVLAWAFSSPALPEPDAPRVRQPTKTSQKANDATVSDEDIAAVANRPLQGPLTLQTVTQPNPPPRTERRVSTPQAPRISLLATIFDEKSKTAIMQDVRGLTDQKRVGETLSLLPSGMRLEAIETDHVRVALRGKSFRIALKGVGSAPRQGTPLESFDDNDEDDDEAPDMSEFEEEPPIVDENSGMMRR